MESAILKVDVKNVRPAQCSRSFRELLGFRTRWGCLRSLSEFNHFQGFNYLQLADKAASFSTLDPIPIVNRRLNRVGIVRNIEVNIDMTEMSIEADPDTSHFTRRFPADDEAIDDSIIFLQPETGNAAFGGNWAGTLGLARSVYQYGVDQFLARVIDEDRVRVRRVLNAVEIPEYHCLWFSLVTQTGRVMPAELTIEVDSVYGRHRTLYCRARECDFRDLSQVALQSLAIELGCPSTGNEVVTIYRQSDVDSLLAILEECLAEEHVELKITLATRDDVRCCSFCDDEPEPQTALVLRLGGYQPSLDELGRLPGRDYDLQRAGGSASWKRLFHEAHEAGYHLTAGLCPEGNLELAFTTK